MQYGRRVMKTKYFNFFRVAWPRENDGSAPSAEGICSSLIGPRLNHTKFS